MALWWLCISSSSKTWKFDFLSQIWPWRSRSITPKTIIGILTKVFCIFCQNLVIQAWMGDKLWCGQAQNGVNLDFQVIFDLESQGLSLHKTTGTLTKVFCIFGPNLVILAWMSPELSHRQASDWHTCRQTDTHVHDAGNDNTWRPKLASGKKTVHVIPSSLKKWCNVSSLLPGLSMLSLHQHRRWKSRSNPETCSR